MLCHNSCEIYNIKELIRRFEEKWRNVVNHHGLNHVDMIQSAT